MIVKLGPLAIVIVILGLALLAVDSAAPSAVTVASTLPDQTRDLMAQEAMAKWAFWMLIASVIGSMLTVVGLAFVWRTLHHTRRAADFAGISIDRQQSASVAQLRAYVGTAGVAYTANLETMCFAVSVETSNFGQTPALKHVSALALNYLPLPANSLPDLPPLTDNVSTIYPTEKISQNITLLLSPERITHVRTGSGAFIATLCIRYIDFVGEPHSDIQRYLVKSSPQSNLWATTHTGVMTILTNLGQLS